MLRQEPELSDCGQFTLQHLDGGEVTLVTCHDLYVTAAMTGTTDLDWALRQETDLSTCGWFTLHHVGSSRVAFTTCADRYVTAMNSEQGRQ